MASTGVAPLATSSLNLRFNTLLCLIKSEIYFKWEPMFLSIASVPSDFINFKTRQISFLYLVCGVAYRSRMCMCKFIEVSLHTYL
jgi:hypothetical protein